MLILILNSVGSMMKVLGENGGTAPIKMALVSPTPVTVAKALVKLIAPIVPLPVVVRVYVIELALAVVAKATRTRSQIQVLVAFNAMEPPFVTDRDHITMRHPRGKPKPVRRRTPENRPTRSLNQDIDRKSTRL